MESYDQPGTQTSAPDNRIRISRAEAMSAHVDDLLNRQRSLRGEQGVTRDRGRRWYYQNWFIFMVVAFLASIAAWAVIEPHFHDYPYVQGTIERINPLQPLPEWIGDGQDFFNFKVEAIGSIQVRGQTVWLVDATREIDHSGPVKRLDAASLALGQPIGVYARYLRSFTDEAAVAFFIDLKPNQSPLANAPPATFRQLAAETQAVSLVFFAVVGGFIGLALGAVDGLICRLPRRALLGGAVGLLVGFLGGFMSGMVANIAYAPINKLAMSHWGSGHSMSVVGFLLQLLGRSLAWALAGTAMGLGQGIALRSKRLLIYGLLGGVGGGLFGGLLFDPIDMLIVSKDSPSAAISRLAGIAIVGAAVGAMIGIVELIARDTWLRMTQGPLAGKEFLIFKDTMKIGASPKSDIYLFNDPDVASHHATLRAVGDECEIEAEDTSALTLLNGRSVRRSRLRHGDNITIGRTSFLFQRRQG